MKTATDSVRHAVAAVWEIVVGRPELLLFTALLVLANVPGLAGSSLQSLAFRADEVRRGEWWRLFTHPWVHVTWYHLLLDATAFLTLQATLLETRWVRRLGYVVAAGAGSLLFAWVAVPDPANGLCGLSGIAHGLMAVSALELIHAHPAGSTERRLGWFSLGLVVAKAAFEAVTGRMFLAFLDFGMLGTPVAVSHAGGIVGALVLRWALSLGRSAQRVTHACPVG